VEDDEADVGDGRQRAAVLRQDVQPLRRQRRQQRQPAQRRGGEPVILGRHPGGAMTKDSYARCVSFPLEETVSFPLKGNRK